MTALSGLLPSEQPPTQLRCGFGRPLRMLFQVNVNLYRMDTPNLPLDIFCTGVIARHSRFLKNSVVVRNDQPNVRTL